MKSLMLAVLLVSAIMAGCVASPREQARIIDDWKRHEGGVVADARVVRVARIGADLVAEARCPNVRFYVLKNRAVTAYSWPTGEVFLTAGLVDAATDDEIAATIAHELGHLLGDTHASSVLSLRGVSSQQHVEERADYIGCRLLCATGRSPGAMVGALEKVCAASGSTECRAEISERIATVWREFLR